MGNDGYTKLLLHFDGADTAQVTSDSSRSAHAVTFNGTAQIDTAQKVFGVSSIIFDGNSDYITIPWESGFDFGTGDFTIDFYYRTPSETTYQVMMELYSAVGTRIIIYKNASGENHLFFLATIGGSDVAFYNTSSWKPSADVFYHLAFVRNGTSFSIYVNGESQSLTTTTAIGTNDLSITSGTLFIGAKIYDGALYTHGWIDEFRISKGIARWTANFTPQGVAYR